MKRFEASTAILVALALLNSVRGEDLTAALSPEELEAVSQAVDRGLLWLSKNQNEDGSLSGSQNGRWGPHSLATAYSVLAFMSRGHQPGQGRYGQRMSQAIDWLLSTQRDSGCFAAAASNESDVGELHALTCLALSEAYVSTSGEQSERIETAIEHALRYTRQMQAKPKANPAFNGGFQWYVEGRIAAVPVSTWNLAFLRSASKAGFQVPQLWVEEGLEFIVRCYEPGPSVDNNRGYLVQADQGVFRSHPKLPLGVSRADLGIRRDAAYSWVNFNTTAAGMWALQLHDRRNDPRVRRAGDWLAEHSVPRQNNTRFYYACYISSEAMSQLGGEYWKNYCPRVVKRLLDFQDEDGHFRLDSRFGPTHERMSGAAYNTALAVLCLTIPDQLLPIHQR